MYKIGNEGSSLKRRAINFLVYGMAGMWGVWHMGSRWGGLWERGVAY
ncbi:hypothetical protein [Bartonella sp. MU70NMGDW]